MKLRKLFIILIIFILFILTKNNTAATEITNTTPEQNEEIEIEKILEQNFGVVDEVYYNEPVIIQFSDVDVTLNNVKITSGHTIDINGEYTLNVYYNEELCKTIHFVFDNVDPVITGIMPNETYLNQNVTINFNEGTAQIDGEVYQKGKPYKKTGQHTILVQDKAGNISSRTFTIYQTAKVVNPYKMYTYSRLLKELKQLEKQYNDLIAISYVGKTYGGKNIPVVTLGKGKKEILIVGALHAREHVTTALIMKSIDTYAQAYAMDRKVGSYDTVDILDDVTFYFVPMLNIDGVSLVVGNASEQDIAIANKAVGKTKVKAYKKLWKANIRGVDLNRNFPFVWNQRTNSPKKPAYMAYKGSKQASEPETQAMIKLCSEHKFAFLFSLHTKGQVVYWKDTKNGEIKGATELANKVRQITGYTLLSPTNSPNGYAGGFENWFRYQYDRPGFCIELTPSSVGYSSANKKFDTTIWNKCKTLFIGTAK